MSTELRLLQGVEEACVEEWKVGSGVTVKDIQLHGLSFSWRETF